MRIHCLQHVHYETPSHIKTWAGTHTFEVGVTHLYDGAQPPSPTKYDWLVVMGGPMSVNDEKQFPWLVEEKRAVERALRAGRTIVGVCLGAQIIADVLGARVYPATQREIGWLPVDRVGSPAPQSFASALPPAFHPFHWHGETFDLPPGATLLAKSEACENQMVLFEEGVVGMQFHLEMSDGGIRDLIRYCGDDLDGSQYVQSPEEMLGQSSLVEASNVLLDSLLNRLKPRR